jgi:hypothetical protein
VPSAVLCQLCYYEFSVNHHRVQEIVPYDLIASFQLHPPAPQKAYYTDYSDESMECREPCSATTEL